MATGGYTRGRALTLFTSTPADHVRGAYENPYTLTKGKILMKNPFHVMIIPTLGCPSKCKYCWSSEEGSPVMTVDTVKEIVEWLRAISRTTG